MGLLLTFLLLGILVQFSITMFGDLPGRFVIWMQKIAENLGII